MSTAVSGMKPRAPKPWDKLRRHVRAGIASQPSSPGSPPGDPGPFHVLRDGKRHERNIANADGAAPSARHSEPTKGADALVELAAQPPLAQAGAASTPPSRVYARSKSAPGASSAPSDSAEKTHVSPDSFSSRTKTTAVQTKTGTVDAEQGVDADVEKNRASDPARTNRAGSVTTSRPVVDGQPDDTDEDAFQWLLTRQLEVEMSLRGAPPNTQRDVEATRETFASFCAFFDALEAGAREVSRRVSAKNPKSTSPPTKNGRAGFLVPPDDSASVPACEPFALFQELLHRVAGFDDAGEKTDVSEQARDGDVPMHQAKVLYRARVATDATLREVDAALGSGTVRDLAATVRRMRAALRVKMEDANDVRMAEEAVRGARRFFDTLQRHARREGKEDVEVLRALREA